MKITIVGRQLNVFEDTKALIEKKLAKLDKFFKDGTAEAVVTLSRKRNTSTVEVTINASGTLFRSEVDADDFRDAMDETIDRIERQIRKNKTRLSKRLRETAFIPDPLPVEAEIEEDPGLIIRTKQFEYHPMTPEEAIMQMNLLGHSFYVFNDVASGDTCVVYVRKDGTYGLIEPMK
ncbi:MAG: ribosome-associated translation inhibitor RaiA [Ruminococcaceae bacterium]|nr:ribosome-associated translation inhibitor RaiA [Oscillospiraceae bacterium]